MALLKQAYTIFFLGKPDTPITQLLPLKLQLSHKAFLRIYRVSKYENTQVPLLFGLIYYHLIQGFSNTLQPSMCQKAF